MSLINDCDRTAEDPNPVDLILKFLEVTGSEPLQLAGASSYKRIEIDGKLVDVAIEAGAESIYPSWPASTLGVVDHPRAWRLDGEIFFSLEPYVGNASGEFVADMFEAAGWRCNPMPRGYGMWAPPRSRLFLVASPDSKADLDAIRSRLLRAKQPFHSKSRHKDHTLQELADEPTEEITDSAARVAMQGLWNRL